MKKTFAAFLSILALLMLSACAPGVQLPPQSTSTPSLEGQDSQNPAPDTVNCSYVLGGQSAKPVDVPSGENVPATGTSTATLQLNGKPVVITLNRAQAPCTVHSFESLAAQGYYDNTTCHRLVDGNGLYILQCGDPSATGMGGPGYTYSDELDGISGYPAGTVSMANSGPNTNGSQFFLVYEDSDLQPFYTVFGTVDSAGLEEIQAIALGGQDGSSGTAGGGKPELPANITSVSVG